MPIKKSHSCWTSCWRSQLFCLFEKRGLHTEWDRHTCEGKNRQSMICLPDSQESLELQKDWKTIKLRIFNTNVKSVLLYGSGTWRMTQ